jgi:hypothetical protein
LNEKHQSTDANPEMSQWLELSDKDYKTTIIKNASRAVGNTFETNEKKKKENLSKEKKEYFLKPPKEIF